MKAYLSEVVYAAKESLMNKFMKALTQEDINNARKTVTRTTATDDKMLLGSTPAATTLKDVSARIIDLMAKYGPDTVVKKDYYNRATSLEWQEPEKDEEVKYRLAHKYVTDHKDSPEMEQALEAAQKKYEEKKRRLELSQNKAKITRIKKSIDKLKQDLENLQASGRRGR